MTIIPRSDSQEFVWVAETGDYEQHCVWSVAASVDAAIADLKAAYGPPYIVRWDEPVQKDAEHWTVGGHFEQVDNHSTKHSNRWEFTRYEVLRTSEAKS